MKKRSLVKNRDAIKKALIAKTSSRIAEGSVKSAPLKVAALKAAAWHPIKYTG